MSIDLELVVASFDSISEVNMVRLFYKHYKINIKIKFVNVKILNDVLVWMSKFVNSLKFEVNCSIKVKLIIFIIIFKLLK